MGLSGDYLLKMLDSSLVLYTPSGVGVCQWLMEDIHLFTMNGDSSLLLHATHRYGTKHLPSITVYISLLRAKLKHITSLNCFITNG